MNGADIGDSVFRPMNAGLVVLGRAPMVWCPMTEIIGVLVSDFMSLFRCRPYFYFQYLYTQLDSDSGSLYLQAATRNNVDTQYSRNRASQIPDNKEKSKWSLFFILVCSIGDA
jgi:hypothetical protein